MEGEMMTVQEIEERFDSEWVLVENPEFDENGEVVRGVVLCHSRNRDEVDRAAVRLRPKFAASLYTGRPAENEVFAL